MALGHDQDDHCDDFIFEKPGFTQSVVDVFHYLVVNFLKLQYIVELELLLLSSKFWVIYGLLSAFGIISNNLNFAGGVLGYLHILICWGDS